MKTIKKISVVLMLLFKIVVVYCQNEDGSYKLEQPYFKIINKNKEVEALPLYSTNVYAKVTGVIADVTITQVYQNSGKVPIEAIYVFPLSDQAAVYSMEMLIGNRTIKAAIKEKEQARKEYEEAKKSNTRASLLEQERPNVFTMNVANIQPGELIHVEIKYTEYLIPENSEYSFVFPTVVGPRYNNNPNAKFAATPYTKSGVAPNYLFTLNMELMTSVPVSAIGCPTHKIDNQMNNERHYSIHLSNEEIYSANKDFILKYKLKGNSIETGIQLFEHNDEKFFLAMVQPPSRIRENEIPPREYIFVVDVSGSMRGFPIDISKKLVTNLLSNLKKSDMFNIVFFSGGSKVLAPKSLEVNNENIQKAIKTLTEMEGGGGTELLQALETSLKLPRQSQTLSRSVVIVTDGYVSVEKEAFDLIKNNLDNTNVFAFGIGSSVNRYLINGLAFTGGGTPFVLTNQENADSVSKIFRKYIQTPILTDIKVDFENFNAYDLIYQKIPNLMAERPIVIIGKYKGSANGKIVVTGKNNNGNVRLETNVTENQVNESYSAIRYLWAREKIKLFDDYGMNGNDSENQKQVVQLGLKYNLLTAYTSFLAIDIKKVLTQSGEYKTVTQVLPLPENVPNSAIGADFDLAETFFVNSTSSNSFLVIVWIFIVAFFTFWIKFKVL